jgi:hypothetical protein
MGDLLCVSTGSNVATGEAFIAGGELAPALIHHIGPSAKVRGRR